VVNILRPAWGFWQWITKVSDNLCKQSHLNQFCFCAAGRLVALLSICSLKANFICSRLPRVVAISLVVQPAYLSFDVHAACSRQIGACLSFDVHTACSRQIGACLSFDVHTACSRQIGACLSFDVHAACSRQIDACLSFDVHTACSRQIGACLSFDVHAACSRQIGACLSPFKLLFIHREKSQSRLLPWKPLFYSPWEFPDMIVTIQATVSFTMRRLEENDHVSRILNFLLWQEKDWRSQWRGRCQTLSWLNDMYTCKCCFSLVLLLDHCMQNQQSAKSIIHQSLSFLKPLLNLKRFENKM